MTKDLKYFMRSDEEKIVKRPAPEGFVDENGNRLQMEIKVLSEAKLQEIRDAYTTKTMAYDKKGNPLISNGEIVWKTQKDIQKINRHFIAEALQYPNLQDKELMDFYKCADIAEMPLKVFKSSEEYEYVWRVVMSTLGLIDSAGDEDNLKEAKN